MPIQTLAREHDEVPETIVRGVIDLVFREDAGWVIVDYKTDDTQLRSVHDLIEHYTPQVRAYAAAWQQLTDEPVAEAGLLFVYGDSYVRVDLESPPSAGGQLGLFDPAPAIRD